MSEAPRPKPRARLNLDDVELDPATTSDERDPSAETGDPRERDAQARRDEDLRRQRPPHHGG